MSINYKKGSTKEAPPSDGTVNNAYFVTRSGFEVKKLNSTEHKISIGQKTKILDNKYIFLIILLMNVKMPAIVVILTFISRWINIMHAHFELSIKIFS